LKSEISTKNNEIERLQKNISTTKVNELESETKAYIDECTRLRYHLESSLKQVLTQNNYTKAHPNSDMQATIDSISAQNQDLSKSLDHYKQQIEKLNQKLLEKQQKYKKHGLKKNDVINLKLELQKLKIQNDQLEKLLKDSQVKENIYKEEIAKLKKTLKDQQTKGIASEQKIKELSEPENQKKSTSQSDFKLKEENPLKYFNNMPPDFSQNTVCMVKKKNVKSQDILSYIDNKESDTIKIEGIINHKLDESSKEIIYNPSNNLFRQNEKNIKDKPNKKNFKEKPKKAKKNSKIPEEKNKSADTKVKNILKHISFRMQINRFPKSKLQITLFGGIDNQTTISKQELITQLKKFPFSITDSSDLNTLSSFLIPSKSTVKSITNALILSLENWEIFSKEDEEKFDQDLGLLISKNKIELKENCKKIDKDNKGIIPTKDFDEIIRALDIKIDERLYKYIELLFYSKDNELDAVPYRYFIKAYGSQIEEEYENDSEDVNESFDSRVALEYINIISQFIAQKNLSVDDVFEYNGEGMVSVEGFVAGLKSINCNLY
jgi:hypothetical protein